MSVGWFSGTAHIIWLSLCYFKIWNLSLNLAVRCYKLYYYKVFTQRELQMQTPLFRSCYTDEFLFKYVYIYCCSLTIIWKTTINHSYAQSHYFLNTFFPVCNGNLMIFLFMINLVKMVPVPCFSLLKKTWIYACFPLFLFWRSLLCVWAGVLAGGDKVEGDKMRSKHKYRRQLWGQAEYIFHAAILKLKLHFARWWMPIFVNVKKPFWPVVCILEITLSPCCQCSSGYCYTVLTVLACLLAVTFITSII